MSITLPSKMECQTDSAKWLTATQQADGGRVCLGDVYFDAQRVLDTPLELAAKEAIRDIFSKETYASKENDNNMLAQWAGYVLLTPKAAFERGFTDERKLQVAYPVEMLRGVGTVAVRGEHGLNWLEDSGSMTVLFMDPLDKLQQLIKKDELAMQKRFSILAVKWPGKK